MSPGQPDPAVVRRHLLALDEAVQHRLLNSGLDDFVDFARFIEAHGR